MIVQIFTKERNRFLNPFLNHFFLEQTVLKYAKFLDFSAICTKGKNTMSNCELSLFNYLQANVLCLGYLERIRENRLAKEQWRMQKRVPGSEFLGWIHKNEDDLDSRIGSAVSILPWISSIQTKSQWLNWTTLHNFYLY